MSSSRRTNSFAGRLLSAEDFPAEQSCHREKLRRHNRLAHGHGVARGLSVSIGGSIRHPVVSVKPGYGIDAAGNELELDSAVSFAIAQKARAFVVLIALEERLVDPVPVAGASGAGEALPFAGVEEASVVALHPDESPDSARKGLVLAR